MNNIANIKNKNESKYNWNIPATYKIHDIIGKGAYSSVASATHLKSGIKVAIKKVVGFLNKKH